MANGIRVLLRPVIQKWPKGELVSGVTFGLEIFGKGPGLAKGDVKPAKLVLHGAFLKKGARRKKDKPKFEKVRHHLGQDSLARRQAGVCARANRDDRLRQA